MNEIATGTDGRAKERKFLDWLLALFLLLEINTGREDFQPPAPTPLSHLRHSGNTWAVFLPYPPAQGTLSMELLMYSGSQICQLVGNINIKEYGGDVCISV